MIPILYYYVFFAPKGAGEIFFKLQGETQERQTGKLTPADLTASLSVLSLRKIAFNPVKGVFGAYDDDGNTANFDNFQIAE